MACRVAWAATARPDGIVTPLDHFLVQLERIRAWQPPQTFRAAARRVRAQYAEWHDGCRCLPCTAANAAYQTERRAIQRQHVLARRAQRRVAA